MTGARFCLIFATSCLGGVKPIEDTLISVDVETAAFLNAPQKLVVVHGGEADRGKAYAGAFGIGASSRQEIVPNVFAGHHLSRGIGNIGIFPGMIPQVNGNIPLDGKFPVCQQSGMEETIYERIQRRLSELGMNETEASAAAGLNPGYIRDLRRKGAHPNVRKIEPLARVLGLSTTFLISGETGTEREQTHGPVVRLTPVIGIIEAGQYRDVSIHNQDEDHQQIPVPQNELFPTLSQYALEVRGDSMNRIVLEGTYVVCVPFSATRLSPKPGMIVHVERSVAGGQLVETTLKEIEEQNGELVLMPRSTNEVHKPIPLDGDDATTIEIRGIVVSLWKPLPKRW